MVEWVKDNVWFEGFDEEFEDELDIEVIDLDDFDDLVGVKFMNMKKKISFFEDVDLEELKKWKGWRWWNFF